jgi:hypothetical protein
LPQQTGLVTQRLSSRSVGRRHGVLVSSVGRRNSISVGIVGRRNSVLLGGSILIRRRVLVVILVVSIGRRTGVLLGWGILLGPVGGRNAILLRSVSLGF